MFGCSLEHNNIKKKSGQDLVNERCLQVYEIQDINTLNDAS